MRQYPLRDESPIAIEWYDGLAADVARLHRRARWRGRVVVLAALAVLVGCLIMIVGCGDPQNLDPVYDQPASAPTSTIGVIGGPATVATTTTVVIEVLDAGATAAAAAVRVDPPDPPVTLAPSTGPEEALVRWGADPGLVAWALGICHRESRCTLDAWNYNSHTRDDSGGPWQINFWGANAGLLADLGITREMVTADWDQAAGAFLVLEATLGRCAWIRPNYCA